MNAKAWIAVSVDAVLWFAGDWWLIGTRTRWLGWLSASVALLGLTYALVGLRDSLENATARSLAGLVVGVLATAGAIWLTPSWRWIAAAVWTVVLIVAIERFFRTPEDAAAGGETS